VRPNLADPRRWLGLALCILAALWLSPMARGDDGAPVGDQPTAADPAPATDDDATAAAPGAPADEAAGEAPIAVADAGDTAPADAAKDDDANAGADEAAGKKDEKPKPAPRTKLTVIPDEVLQQAQSDSFLVIGGPQITDITGNANRFRRYTFVVPSSPFVLDEMRAAGTNDDGGWMYDGYIDTPMQLNRSAGLMVRDFDGPTTGHVAMQRYGFFADFGPTATPTTRRDGVAEFRTRFGGTGWLDVEYTHRDLTSPAFTSRAQGFVYDSLGAETNWRFGGAQVSAFADAGRYTDATQAIDPRGRQLTANRGTFTAGLKASSTNYSDVQWYARAAVTRSTYPNIGQTTTVSASAALRWSMSHDFSLKTGLAYAAAPQTITRNTYNPWSATFRATGTYRPNPKWRAYFGYERRYGTRYSTQPVLGGADLGFVENQTVDRLWVKGRMKSHSDLIVEAGVNHRRVSGAATTYIGNSTTAAPLLLFPSRTSAEVTASYPMGIGLVKGGLAYANYTNGVRGTAIDTWGAMGHWTKAWSDQWTTTAQYDLLIYDTGRSQVAGLDTTLGSFVTEADWSFHRGSVTGSYGLFDSRGAFAARQQTLGLAVNYEASEDTHLTLSYENQSETQTATGYQAHVVMLRAAHDF
jgi:hypothetical protein